MKMKIEKDSESQCQKQIELAAEQLAQILIQQVTSKNNQIKNNDGKLSK